MMSALMPQILALAAAVTLLAACAVTTADAPAEPVYGGSEPLGLGGDLYGFLVTMKSLGTANDLDAYVTCVVAGYTLKKNYGFARKVRTNVKEEGGVWIADAVYTISPTLPRGLKTIDAEVTVADCAERGIPTV